jgi:hypothetical protein
MTRIAHYCCGLLRTEATGEPAGTRGGVSLYGVPKAYWLALPAAPDVFGRVARGSAAHCAIAARPHDQEPGPKPVTVKP